ncbi:hypothetical protein LPN01_02445 [Sphingomonas sp. A2-49]|uniref:hypothetical protein n=1 Tax=Sphingomonas sp. A2-49 TaxID=1391375 RepID=UPI0021D26F56|nr:hypothetical protein [Sphingomonas sp. A2-49]MCU6452930.1 hypothetical protein [Sphingomonas sp. A2-49]
MKTQEMMMAEQNTQGGMGQGNDTDRQDQDRDQGMDRQQNQQNRDQGAGQNPNRTDGGQGSGAGYGNHGDAGRDDAAGSDRGGQGDMNR